jgi:metallo-beta-lactamase family protein
MEHNKHQVRVTFHGGTGSVTGANFLLENVAETREGTNKILIDCGLYQGDRDADTMNYSPFAYDPADIDILIVTHAHADHIGRIPRLVKEGFSGKIYSTKATRELTELMFQDSLEIITYEAEKENKEPMYGQDDVKRALELWRTVSFHDPLDLGLGFHVSFFQAGHILGSAIAKFSYGSKNIVFTGDLGNSPDPILRDNEVVTDAHYMIMESVYGDRNHEEREERINKLKEAINETVAKKGVLLIPSFALERTQTVLYVLNELAESGEIPKIPVFLDSPLAIDITAVFKKYPELFNDQVQKRLKTDPDVFSFPGLVETYSMSDSKGILKVPGPKVIISSAGMSHAGRIIHHEKQYLDEAENMVLFIGYQAVGTLGRIIQDGAEKVTIFGKEVPIRATIRTISGYSAHKDSDHLLEFVGHSQDTLQHVFVTMGETKAALFLVQRIRDYLGIKATAPQLGDSIVLDMD